MVDSPQELPLRSWEGCCIPRPLVSLSRDVSPSMSLASQVFKLKENLPTGQFLSLIVWSLSQTSCIDVILLLRLAWLSRQTCRSPYIMRVEFRHAEIMSLNTFDLDRTWFLTSSMHPQGCCLCADWPRKNTSIELYTLLLCAF